jgi:hypothetical protein
MTACVFVAVAVSVAVAQPAQATNEDAFGSTLHTGHCLTTSPKEPLVYLESPSERFRLYFSGGDLQLDNEVRVPRGSSAGYEIWDRTADHNRGTSSTLCMQKDGNLVFRGHRGFVAWSTHTSGTGRHNYASVTGSGRLVVRTSTGGTVWSSGTTAVLLRVGDRVASGTVLSNYTAPGRTTHLEMRKSGDLVLTHGTTTVWHTNSHIRGSYLEVTSTGRLVVYSPKHRAVWKSRRVGHNAVVMVAQSGRLTINDDYTRICWVRPLTANPDCGRG